MERAWRAAAASNQPLVVALSLLGLAAEERLAHACSELYRAPVVEDIAAYSLREDPAISAGFLRGRYGVLLEDSTGNFCLGLVDPGDPDTLDGVTFALGHSLPILTLRLSQWRQLTASADEKETPSGDASIDDTRATWLDDTERLRDSASDAPIIRMLDELIEQAWIAGASDIHIEQKSDHTRIRLRADGILRDLPRQNPAIGPGLIARVKVLSDLDVAERRLPQDGRTTVPVRGVPVDIRVASAPSVFGESLVIRLLTRRNVEHDLDRLGLRPEVRDGLTTLLSRPHGLLLVTGPTGSGKTTTLYSALRRLATSRTKILTIEDPIEYVFEDIQQSQVNEAAGFGFAGALRAFLRHDPDVILVGEIRDTETARLAIQASLTGHLVLATVHTNDAVTTPSRLIDMGVERYLLADALIGVLAQRLVSRICNTCAARRQPDEIEVAVLAEVGIEDPSPLITLAGGCDLCEARGRRGRIVISELMTCDRAVRELIAAGASAEALRNHLLGLGHISLRHDALLQSLSGHLDWNDALRVAET